MIDVAVAIDKEAIPLVLRRKADPTYTAQGDVVPGGMVETGFSGTLLALVLEKYGDAIKDRLEGIALDGLRMLYSRTPVEIDDIVLHLGQAYRVLALWPRYEGGFYRAAIGRLKT